MSNEEAIDIIKTAISEVEWEYPVDYAVALEKAIEALEGDKKESNSPVGYKGDEIFLLSVSEYEKYKSVIQATHTCWWWLRSPGGDSSLAAHVGVDGVVSSRGYMVDDGRGCVRPALKISNIESEDLKIGECFALYDNRWIYLGDDIAISENQIGQHEFDNEINDYETSEIRGYLLKWLEVRK